MENAQKCNCIADFEAKLIDRVKEQNPTWELEEINHFDGTGLQNIAFTFGHGNIVYNEFKVRYTFPKVNGEMSTPKTHKLSLYPTYCCYCGIKLTNDGN